MRMLASIIGTSALLLSTLSSAAVFTQGDLTYDDATGIISGNGKEYLGFDIGRHWTYAQTLAQTQAGGTYESFSIATTADADFFIDSIFGANPDNCSTVDGLFNGTVDCGVLPDWTDGKFGASFHETFDYVWFLAEEHPIFDVGYIEIDTTQPQPVLAQAEGWADFAFSDTFSSAGPDPLLTASWLLVRDAVPTPAPTPSIFALIAIGFAGLGLISSRRREA